MNDDIIFIIIVVVVLVFVGLISFALLTKDEFNDSRVCNMGIKHEKNWLLKSVLCTCGHHQYVFKGRTCIDEIYECKKCGKIILEGISLI